MQQLALPAAPRVHLGRDQAPVPNHPWGCANALGQWLSRQSSRSVHVVYTNNRSTMMSLSERRGLLQLRLHNMFVGAGELELRALAAYVLTHDRRASEVLSQFIERNSDKIDQRPMRVIEKGEHHHLGEIFDRLNAAYFHDACQSQITWGSPGARKRRRTIQLGCFVHAQQLIRIHPCLDQAFVPAFYVGWVIFHEMLHEVFGYDQRGSRRHYHPPAFCALEQSHPDYERAKHWENSNLDRLLRYRPRRS